MIHLAFALGCTGEKTSVLNFPFGMNLLSTGYKALVSQCETLGLWGLVFQMRFNRSKMLKKN